jgi:hypothetical protein
MVSQHASGVTISHHQFVPRPLKRVGLYPLINNKKHLGLFVQKVSMGPSGAFEREALV